MPGFPDWLSQQVAQNQLLVTDQTIIASGNYAVAGIPSWAYGVVWTAAPAPGNPDFNPFYLQVVGGVTGANYVYPSAPGVGGEPMSVMRPMLAHPVAAAADPSLQFTVRLIGGGSGNAVHVRAYAVAQIPDMPLPPIEVAGGIPNLANSILVPSSATNVFRLEGCSLNLLAAGGGNASVSVQASFGGTLRNVARLFAPLNGYWATDFDLHGMYTDVGISVLYNVTGGLADAEATLYYRQMI